MTHWLLKAAAGQLLSYLPVGRNLREMSQRHVSRSLPFYRYSRTHVFDYATDRKTEEMAVFFKMIVNGECDAPPEQPFKMAGAIEDGV